MGAVKGGAIGGEGERNAGSDGRCSAELDDSTGGKRVGGGGVGTCENEGVWGVVAGSPPELFEGGPSEAGKYCILT